MDIKLLGALVVLLEIIAGTGALAVLSLGQWLMAAVFIGWVAVRLVSRLRGDDSEDDQS